MQNELVRFTNLPCYGFLGLVTLAGISYEIRGHIIHNFLPCHIDSIRITCSRNDLLLQSISGYSPEMIVFTMDFGLDFGID